jgi:hypothetical protein
MRNQDGADLVTPPNRRRSLGRWLCASILLLCVACPLWLAAADSVARPLDSSAWAEQRSGWGAASVADTSFPFARDARVAQMIEGVRQSDAYGYAAGLSGRTPITVGGAILTLSTRNAYNGTLTNRATQYVYEFMRVQGLSVSYQQWTDAAQELSGRNVIGAITGAVHPDEIVLITAHLDDMPEGSSAPGTDDDASGCVGVMMAAMRLTTARLAGTRFERTVRFVFFTGEEYDFLGSIAYAGACSQRGEKIVAVLNLDMIGWDGNNDGLLCIHTRNPGNAGYPRDLAIANVLKRVVDAYAIGHLEMTVHADYDRYSDSVAFWDVGYPAILAIEDEDEEWNPYYHTRNDTVETLNLPFFTRYVKAAVGTLAHLAAPLGAVSVSLPLVLK